MIESLDLAQNGKILDIEAEQFPISIWTWKEGNLTLPRGATYYGMVTRGNAYILGHGRTQLQPLDEGSYFCTVDETEIIGRESAGLVIAAHGYRGYSQTGGPIEKRGRLKYIDGCSDTLLICAPVVGEPCLNHLHIPPGTNQTAHTHPSERIGVILRGSGYCETPDGVQRLEEGMGWRIPPGHIHSFHTGEREFLDVIAWHPDSDFGPNHQDHPMVNKTYVNDVAASHLPCIQTRDIVG